MSLVIVDRQTWGAEPPRMSRLLETPVTQVFVTSAFTELCYGDYNCMKAVQRLQKYQVGRVNLPDIQYNFCIGSNGRVYEGRGWHARATLLKRHREFTDSSLFIGFIGKNLGDPEHKQVRYRVLKTLHELIEYGVRKNYISSKFLLVDNFHCLKLFDPECLCNVNKL